MEHLNSELTQYQIRFEGKSGEFSRIYLSNILLSLVSLSLYTPWAAAKQMKYLCNHFSFEGAKLEFHGNGKEMFSSFLKLFSFILIFQLASASGAYYFKEGLALFFTYFAFTLLFPIYIHSTIRYTMASMSWRGIRLAYIGDRKELFLNFIQWSFFNLITLGIYSFWTRIKMTRYIVRNLRIGNMEMRFKGREIDYFKLAFRGNILTFITCGIYSFWFIRQLNHFFINNTTFYKDGLEIRMKSTLTLKQTVSVTATNLLIILLTLGLGTPVAIIRWLKIVCDNIQTEGTIDLYSIEPVYNDYEESYDFLDIKLPYC